MYMDMIWHKSNAFVKNNLLMKYNSFVTSCNIYCGSKVQELSSTRADVKSSQQTLDSKYCVCSVGVLTGASLNPILLLGWPRILLQIF